MPGLFSALLDIIKMEPLVLHVLLATFVQVTHLDMSHALLDIIHLEEQGNHIILT